jgi:hypothetical protein
MPAAYRLSVSEAARAQLEQVRAHHPKPCVRERAAALLAIAAGASIRQAARTAGLQPHKPATLCAWVARYQAEGVAGLRIRTGRGRKPASFPAGQRPGARAGAGGGG